MRLIAVMKINMSWRTEKEENFPDLCQEKGDGVGWGWGQTDKCLIVIPKQTAMSTAVEV